MNQSFSVPTGLDDQILLPSLGGEHTSLVFDGLSSGLVKILKMLLPIGNQIESQSNHS